VLHKVKTQKYSGFCRRADIGVIFRSAATKQITVPKAAVSFFRKGRVVGDFVFKPQPAEPAIRKVSAHAAVVGRFLHQGQICMSVNRVIVDKSVYAEFSDLVAERVRAPKIGAPNRPDTVTGTVINNSQLDGLLRKIDNAKTCGLQQLAGGNTGARLAASRLRQCPGSSGTGQATTLIKKTKTAEAVFVMDD
jgi:hypothetical protein